MLTVVFVQQDRLAGIFERYKFLFQPFINDGNVKFCDWNTAGRDAESAIPDIYKVVGNAECWRAVILTDLNNAENDNDKANKINFENPFDLCDLNTELDKLENDRLNSDNERAGKVKVYEADIKRFRTYIAQYSAEYNLNVAEENSENTDQANEKFDFVKLEYQHAQFVNNQPAKVKKLCDRAAKLKAEYESWNIKNDVNSGIKEHSDEDNSEVRFYKDFVAFLNEEIKLREEEIQFEQRDAEKELKEYNENKKSLDVKRDNEKTKHPLIVLSNILGGIPDKVSTKLTVCKEEDCIKGYKVDTEIKPHRPESLKKFKLDIVRPERIIFVSPRAVKENNAVDFNRLKAEVSNELQSSQFYHRNDYPGACRFVVYDVPEYMYSEAAEKTYKGNVKYYFKFFLVSLVIALNVMDPSTFQSYRLYKANVDIDEDELCKALNFLLRKRRLADREIAEFERSLYRKVTLEDEFDNDRELGKVIAMSFNSQDRKPILLNSSEYGLCKDIPRTDIEVYVEQLKTVNKNLAMMEKRFRRSLETAAGEMLAQSELSDETKALPTGKWQLEDISDYTLDKEKEMAMACVGEAFVDSVALAKKEQTDQKLKKTFSYRMTKKTAFLAIMTMFLCVVFAFLPFACNMAAAQDMQWSYPAVFLALLFGVFMIIAALCVLLYDWYLLRKLLSEFNGIMHSIIDKMQVVSGQLSRFMSACVSFMRGKSMFDYKTRDISKDNERYQILQHREALNKAESIYRTLAECYRLQLEEHNMNQTGVYPIDVMAIPGEDLTYLLEPETDNISFNSELHFGAVVKAPYRFITNFSLVREEIYEKTEDKKSKNADTFKNDAEVKSEDVSKDNLNAETDDNALPKDKSADESVVSENEAAASDKEAIVDADMEPGSEKVKKKAKSKVQNNLK